MFVGIYKGRWALIDIFLYINTFKSLNFGFLIKKKMLKTIVKVVYLSENVWICKHSALRQAQRNKSRILEAHKFKALFLKVVWNWLTPNQEPLSIMSFMNTSTIIY